MPRAVRILLDYRPALRQRTGVGQYVHELASALQRLLSPTDALILFSSSWKDRLDRNAVPGARAVDLRIPVSVLNAAWHRLEWPPVELLAGPVDIAHSLHPLMMAARSAAKVITVHDLDFLDHPERTRAEIRRDYAALAPRHAQRADLVVVNSHYTAGAVQARLGVPPERTVVCRPGAPALWAPRDPPTAVGHILFVGTIEPRKNLPILFSAYRRLLDEPRDIPPLVLAGKRVEQSAEILDAATRGRLAGRIRYLGYVTDAERYRLYREASMLVIPSFEEGFGMTALEAMQVGVPVAASSRGALPEVLGPSAVFFDPENVGDVAAAIARLLDDRTLRAGLAAAGRARAQQFTWEESARALLDAYRRVHSPRDEEAPC